MSESAPEGEADSGNGGTDKEFSCDACGSVHDTQRALSIHEAHAHGGPVDGSGYDCPGCDRSFSCRRGVISHLSRESTCGAGEECEECGRTFPTKRGWRAHKKQEHGIDTRPTVECVVCGEERQVDPNYLDKRERSYCSDECFAEWRAENWSGKDHPLWKGGRESDYGPEWQEKRKQVLERDNRQCQYCGKHDQDASRSLSVHHIKPLREFDSIEKANKISNLVCLCRPCHHSWEGIPLRPKLI